MKNNIIIASVFLILGIVMGSQIGCRYQKAQYTTVKTDTLIHFIPRTDTLYKTIEMTNNIPYTVWGHDTVLIHQVEKITGIDTSWLTQYIHLSDTAVYRDTLRQKDEFKAEIFDTLTNNRIIGREVRWANLAPTEVRDITKTVVKKPSLVKVYVGVDGYGGKSGGKFNADIAPAGSFVFADKYLVDLGYYVFNQEVTAGFKIKLQFRK